MAGTSSYPVPNGSIPPAQGTMFKCTFFINGPNCGFTETYYVTPGVTNPSEAIMGAVAIAYAAARVQGMIPLFSVQAMRYSDVTIPGNSNLLVPWNTTPVGTYESGPSASSNQNPFPNIGAQVRLSDSLNVVRRNEIYRGIPNAWISATPGTNNSLNFTDPKFINWRHAMNAWYQNVQGVQNGQAGQACLRFQVKNPSLNASVPIASITSTNGNLTVCVPTQIASLNATPTQGVGLPLRVGGIRLKCARKLNGIATILQLIAPTTQNPNWCYVLCKPFCCQGQTFICPRNGTASAVLYGYTSIINTSGQVVASRKTGRPFRLRPGRRLACCA